MLNLETYTFDVEGARCCAKVAKTPGQTERPERASPDAMMVSSETGRLESQNFT